MDVKLLWKSPKLSGISVVRFIYYRLGSKFSTPLAIIYCCIITLTIVLGYMSRCIIKEAMPNTDETEQGVQERSLHVPHRHLRMADFTDSAKVSASTSSFRGSLPISIHISTVLIGLWRPHNAHQDKTTMRERTEDEDEELDIASRCSSSTIVLSYKALLERGSLPGESTDITDHEDSRDGRDDDDSDLKSSGANLQGSRRDSPDVVGKYIINYE